MARARLDKLVVKRELAGDLDQARALIDEGMVRVGGITNSKPASMVDTGADIKVREDTDAYVSRGAHKLVKALTAFAVDPSGLRVMDIGSSTGGFTDVLLRAGAAKVYAIDVGYGQLAWKLRQDERVVVLERENIRKLDVSKLQGPIDLSVIDVSFISLTLILGKVAELMQGAGKSILALIKPQFEARKDQVGKGGVVRSQEIRQECIDKVCDWARARGFAVSEVVESPIRGPAGNVEFLVELRTPGAL